MVRPGPKGPAFPLPGLLYLAGPGTGRRAAEQLARSAASAGRHARGMRRPSYTTCTYSPARSQISTGAAPIGESGGNWSADTGNGFYGGLQFTGQTWLGYGGGQYAPSANLATPAQQIAVAQKVPAGQGIGAWPVCGARG